MRPQLPVAASTGLSEKQHLTELQALGVTKLLHKPYGAPELLQAVHSMLRAGA